MNYDLDKNNNNTNQTKKKTTISNQINIMSFNVPFFSFFDAINNEVDSFNRALNEAGYNNYQPRRQLTASRDAKNQQLQKSDKSGSQSLVPSSDSWLEDDWSLWPSFFDAKDIAPPVDILEHENNYELNITIPGVKSKKDIDLEYHKEHNQILVSGEIPSNVTKENEDKVKVKEGATGKFKRVITLPKYPGVDADNIKADYANGILKLTVPKLKPTDPKDGVQKIAISSQESWGN